MKMVAKEKPWKDFIYEFMYIPVDTIICDFFLKLLGNNLISPSLEPYLKKNCGIIFPRKANSRIYCQKSTSCGCFL